jgi:hypothetical protein
MFTLKPHIVRPSVRVQAKKNNFVEPAEAPGEGRRRPPNEEDMHPIKKFIMEKFNIEEIDYEKFNKENKWAIRPGQKKGDKE